MIVLKFGGTSLAGREALHRAISLSAKETQPVVVVSAIDDTTDRLIDAGDAAEKGDESTVSTILSELRAMHQTMIGGAELFQRELSDLFNELTTMLEGVHLLREQSARSRALIVSFGERLSARIFAAVAVAKGRPAVAIDTRELIVTDDRYAGANVQIELTSERLANRLLPLIAEGIIPVMTGFIAATPQGITTTLGRGGSDYTATIVGCALRAAEIHIMTDVDGVFSADPRLVKEARSLAQISYREAAEMSHFGAKVLHPRTILPAEGAEIPIRVRNTHNPDHPGTLITDNSPTDGLGVKAVASIDNQALVTISGRGMAGVPGAARRILEASELASVSVTMISQSSSEQAVSLVVPAEGAAPFVATLEERLAPELARGLINRINVKKHVAVVSVIGQGMAGQPGVSGRFFGALGSAGVNVVAIAQGASELSISVAVAEKRALRAVRAVHTAFGLTRLVHLVMVGCGRVGKELLRILEQTQTKLFDELDLQLRLVAAARSSKFIADGTGLSPSSLAARWASAENRPTDPELLARVLEEHFTDGVLVDVTATDTTELHLLALRSGLHVVTANKVPLSQGLAQYHEIMQACREFGVHYNYETTFGAGLPVLHTLSELVNTGDELLEVRGCLSGTLGAICSWLDEGVPIREAVHRAEQLGYTEPDPREDLSGRDVARKALIIARASGMELEPADVVLEPMVPGLEQGLEQALEAAEGQLGERLKAAHAKGAVLRYVAEIAPGRVHVGLREVDKLSPIGSLSGPDNIFVFRTQRYREHPLVIRGPGAGVEVTAAGVLGDVLKIAISGRQPRILRPARTSSPTWPDLEPVHQR